MRKITVVTLGFLLLCASAPVLGAAQSKALPPAIQAAFERAYPHAVVTHWATEKSSTGEIVIGVESMDGKQRRDLLYSTKGEVLEVEDVISASELPPAVATAVNQHFPGAVMTRAERLIRKQAVEYEIALKGAKTKEAVFDSNGKLVSKP